MSVSDVLESSRVARPRLKIVDVSNKNSHWKNFYLYKIVFARAACMAVFFQRNLGSTFRKAFEIGVGSLLMVRYALVRLKGLRDLFIVCFSLII